MEALRENPKVRQALDHANQAWVKIQPIREVIIRAVQALDDKVGRPQVRTYTPLVVGTVSCYLTGSFWPAVVSLIPLSMELTRVPQQNRVKEESLIESKDD